MTEQEKIADYWTDWLIDAVGMATQNRALLRDDPAEDNVLTQAIVLNGKKAILNAMKAPTDSLDTQVKAAINHHNAVELVRRFEMESMALHRDQKIWLIREIGLLLTKVSPLPPSHSETP
jgi:hypothetical protein